MKKNICLKSFLIALCILFIQSCSKQREEVLILWTDNIEFASYAELFNASQDSVKVAVVYKAETLDHLPVEKGGTNPDLIAAGYLTPGIAKHYFSPLNGIFSDRFTKEAFYPGLLEAGKKGNTQYLLPVNFNAGAFVFDVNNSDLIEGTGTINYEQIKKASKEFNAKSADNLYTKMAFAPQWNPDFLYKVLAADDVKFSAQKNEIKYNIPLVEKNCEFLIDWTKTTNTSCNDEKDFAFKYLYTPYNKQVLQQKSLFAYTTSDRLLSLTEEQLDKIDFCWFEKDTNILTEENNTMIGIYKKSKSKKACQMFISWFMTEEAQSAMLKRKIDMNLDSNTFGIANGFSSLISVNEHIFPVYYKCLLAKVPASSSITAPAPYPPQWVEIKRDVIIPYLKQTLEGKTDSSTLSKMYKDWENQNKEE
ncbi:MAG: hypothetical protein J6Y36_00945 [Treponema sp.]|nr:hypothetical protein [Treponema sp.]